MKRRIAINVRPSVLRWLLGLVALSLAACSGADEPELELRERMPISLYLPAAALTRSPGDPGEPAKDVLLPQHLYLFFVFQLADNSFIIERDHKVLSNDPAAWEKVIWSSTMPQSAEDVVYRYVGTDPDGQELAFDRLPLNRKAARVYAVVSPFELNFNPALSTTYPATEEEIKNLTVDFSEDDYPQLRGVYSSPAAYTDANGTYYGTVSDISTHVPSVQLMLYRIAARVDLMWNVEPSLQSGEGSVRLSAMQLRGLKNHHCLLFLPTSNLGLTVNGDGSRGLTAIGPDFDEGNQWYGRHYFYAIPYRQSTSEDYFPLTLALWKNDDTPETLSSGCFTRELHINLPGDLSDNPFVPWLRGEFVVAGPLY